MKNSQQHLGNETNVTLRKNINLNCSQATFSLSHDVIFLMVTPLLGRFLVSFHLQSAICGLQSAVCSLQMSYTAQTFIHKRSVFSMKDKQSIIGRLEKGEKGTNLSAEYGVSKQQISDIRKNKETSMKFASNLETAKV